MEFELTNHMLNLSTYNTITRKDRSAITGMKCKNIFLHSYCETYHIHVG